MDTRNLMNFEVELSTKGWCSCWVPKWWCRSSNSNRPFCGWKSTIWLATMTFDDIYYKIRQSVKYSNIRRRIFDFALSNPNQGFWIFVEPESRFWESNIRFWHHWFGLCNIALVTNSLCKRFCIFAILSVRDWYIMHPLLYIRNACRSVTAV